MQTIADNSKLRRTHRYELIGVKDGKVEAIGAIYNTLYGGQAMIELWQSVYPKEDTNG